MSNILSPVEKPVTYLDNDINPQKNANNPNKDSSLNKVDLDQKNVSNKVIDNIKPKNVSNKTDEIKSVSGNLDSNKNNTLSDNDLDVKKNNKDNVSINTNRDVEFKNDKSLDKTDSNSTKNDVEDYNKNDTDTTLVRNVNTRSFENKIDNNLINSAINNKKEKKIDKNNNIKIISKIEQNLMYSNNLDENKSSVKIEKGLWSKKDLVELKQDKKFNVTTKKSKNFDLSTKETEDLKRITYLKDEAYKAINLNQYEIAIKYYKDILKINPKDNFTKLSLATSYHILGQYVQAKPFYIELLPVFPNSEQLVSNLLSIIIQESPYELVYLLPTLANKYDNSATIQAQTSVAFSSVSRYKDAIKYITKAIELDPYNIRYNYNLAVLYDKIEDYGKAYSTYKNVYDSLKITPDNSLSMKSISDRMRVIKKKYL